MSSWEAYEFADALARRSSHIFNTKPFERRKVWSVRVQLRVIEKRKVVKRSAGTLSGHRSKRVERKLVMIGQAGVGAQVDYSALGIARCLLARAHEEDELLSHLKLQKLLYFCQGFTLAMTGKPLFSEAIVAWEHGPVVREVWDE